MSLSCSIAAAVDGPMKARRPSFPPQRTNRNSTSAQHIVLLVSTLLLASLLLASSTLTHAAAAQTPPQARRPNDAAAFWNEMQAAGARHDAPAPAPASPQPPRAAVAQIPPPPPAPDAAAAAKYAPPPPPPVGGSPKQQKKNHWGLDVDVATQTVSTSATPSPTIPTSEAAAAASSTPTIGLPIPNYYIISVNDSAPAEQVDAFKKRINQLVDQYNANMTALNQTGNYKGVVTQYGSSGWNGFHVNLPEEVIKAIKDSPLFEYVESDRYVGIGGVQATSGFVAEPLNKTIDVSTQVGAPWGLQRIGSRSSVSSGVFKYAADGGQNVTIYVLDTGIRSTHQEFGSRAVVGPNFIQEESAQDLNGHGTHVAGIAAGSQHGVARAATVVGVKVLDKGGSGAMSNVISALEWVMQDAATPARKTRDGKSLWVANLSLGKGGISQALDDMVTKAVSGGGTIVAAAGNDGDDACTNSPADSAMVLTVAAMAGNDSRALFSNHGRCVSIFAPGVSVESSWATGDSSYAEASGTRCGFYFYFYFYFFFGQRSCLGI
ncbi:peptidase S8/S53 domain-containing protein [Zopfochytrium polystomum]|nr:peptidase S8/S53 domain-containing protein [Zopfochytrium polystomum]